jgi:neutral ceramidase
VKASGGIHDVIFNASHTHSGPVLNADAPGEWQKRAAAEVASAIEQAWKARQSVRAGVGQGSVLIGHNRLHHMAKGAGKMLWRNETRIPTSPVDPTVLVLRLDRADGSTLALLVNYACHPVVLGPENLDYSADFPGEMMRAVESSFPGNPVTLYFQGAAGDINPYYDKTSPAENGVALMKQTGQELAQEVLKVARAIETKALPGIEIQSSREVLEFDVRWDREKLLARLAAAPPSAYRTRFERALKEPLRAPVTVALVGREFALVGVPAEIFVDYQRDIRERVKQFPVFFGGYTNGAIGYVPTIKGAVDGGYGASSIGAYAEVGAGSRMIDHAIVRLGYLTGRLRNEPQ